MDVYADMLFGHDARNHAVFEAYFTQIYLMGITLMNYFIPIIIFFLLWVFTGFYLATQYQKLVQQVLEFREGIKQYALENGTTDEKLYGLVIESSRDILSSIHPTKIAKNNKPSI